MCGISLIFTKRADVRPRIATMNALLRHRGPDDTGVWISPDGEVGLGHRRLAILDLSPRGHQPMQHAGAGLVLVFNGEIYNYREIRAELEKTGCVFKSTSDTEVILAAYATWGAECLKRFNGMWALALYDGPRRRILLSRDRLGMKPLYLAEHRGDLIVASEVKAILAAGVAPAIDPVALDEYLTFQNVISGRTLFAGVRMLAAGHNLWVDLETGRQTTECYWEVPSVRSTMSERDATERVRELLAAAVERHLISDVPVGVTLSGGLDSSAVVGLMSRRTPHVHTFTGFFDTTRVDADDRCVNEQDDARMIAQRFATRHHERQITPQDLICGLPAIVWHLEDPKVGMCYTFHAMAQLVGSWVTVNLSGTGGDELFAGYTWRYGLIEGLTDRRKFSDAYYAWWSRLLKDEQKKGFFTAKAWSGMEAGTTRKVFDACLDGAGDRTPLGRALYFDLKTFLHGFLMVEDKLGMAYSVETRFPFLDRDLVECAFSLPDDFKLRAGGGKYILKQALASLLPEDAIHKRKQGFTPPDKTWFRRELADYTSRMLLSPKSCLGEYVQRSEMQAVLDRHARGSDERLMIWSLLFLEGWCRVFLQAEGGPTARAF